MGTTSDKLLYLEGTKEAIKDAIIAKGVAVPTGTPFRDYATKIGDITTGGGTPVADTWVRPTEWLALPNNIDGVQKVSILNAVFDTDSEFVAFLCRGAYTVDWGDGTIENFADNAKANHKYDYTNANLNSNTVTKFGYKQCIITITPQAGNSLTLINLNYYHSSIGSSATYDLVSGFLDIRINSLSCTAISIGNSSDYVKHSMLEQCLIGELADTTLSYLFNNCYSLQSVSFKDTSNVTDWSYAFNNCYALQKMPNITFKANCNCYNMFNNCYSLYEVPPISLSISTGGATNVVNMFYNCSSLPYIDLTISASINYSLGYIFTSCKSLADIKLTLTGTGKVTSLVQAFAYTRIRTAPTIDTSACTTFANCFQYCDKLVTVPQYDYSVTTTLANMFDSCYSLKSVPNFNTSTSLTNLSAMFNSCYSLETAPTFSVSSNVTNIFNMFYACKSLKTVPSYVFGNISSTNFQTVFNSCDSLQSIPNITVGTAYTTNSGFCTYCYSLKRMTMPLRFTFDISNAKMSAVALNEMYTALPTVTGQTVTVTGNYGTTSDDPSIATAKGWTVVG